MLFRQRKQVARMIKTAHTANMAQADLTAIAMWLNAYVESAYWTG